MRRCVLLTACLALPATLAAQATPSGTPARPQWTLGGELSLTELSGNRSLTLITSGLNAKRVTADGASLEAQAAARYGTSNGNVATENYRAEVSARFRPLGRVSPSLRLAANRDPIKGLDLRISIATGASIELLSAGDQELQLGMALLADREYRDLPAGSTLEREVTSTRFDLRLRARIPLRESVTLEHQTVVQPVANNPSDYLLTTRSAIQVFLTRQLALQTSYLLERDATPLPSVEFKDDRTLTVGVLVRFRSGN